MKRRQRAIKHRWRCASAALALACVMAAAPAWADSVSKESSAQVASNHYETGLALFELGRFDEAVSEFRKAYEVEARTDFLLHIGRSYERLNQTDKALYFFKRFLQKAPATDPFRDEVQEYVNHHDGPQAGLPSEGLLPKDDDLGLTTPMPAAAPPVPVWHKWWFWTAVGSAALLVAGTSYVLLRESDEGPPNSDLGHMRFE